MGSLRFAAAAAFSLLLAACATTPDNIAGYETPGAVPYSIPQDRSATGRWSDNGSIETPASPLQCVPYARRRSGIDIHGDAASWWEKAAGHYLRSSEPSMGAVLVLTGYAGPHRGHVAVVTALESPRWIRVDHANWLDDGKIYLDDPVVDVSSNNDWSEVRVWDQRDGVLGRRVYRVRGFIDPDPYEQDDRIASRN